MCPKCDASRVFTLRSQQFFELGSIINFIVTNEKTNRKYGIFLRFNCWLMTMPDFIALRAQFQDNSHLTAYYTTQQTDNTTGFLMPS